VLLASCEELVDVALDVPTNAARDCDLPTLLGAKAKAVNGSKKKAAPMDQRFNIFFGFYFTTRRRIVKTKQIAYKVTGDGRQDASRNGKRTLATASVNADANDDTEQRFYRSCIRIMAR
jgi:hypothetical protein